MRIETARSDIDWYEPDDGLCVECGALGYMCPADNNNYRCFECWVGRDDLHPESSERLDPLEEE
jgi:hypothetical protein